MLKKTIAGLATILVIGSQTVKADYTFCDWGFNVDGTTEVFGDGGDPTSFGQDLSDFDVSSGTGTISFSISGTGSHNVDAFFDHELIEKTNTYFNETASQMGSISKPAGSVFSWEVDEPGWSFGDIVDNLYDSDYDGEIYPGLADYEALTVKTDTYPLDEADDVAVGMGWDFILTKDQTATLSYSVSKLIDDNSEDFYIVHQDNAADL